MNNQGSATRTAIPLVKTNAGIAMPKIIYGTAWKQERTTHLVTQALAAGFRGFDTAAQPKHYDEDGVGAGFEQAFASGLDRGEVFVQTKFTPVRGQDPSRIPYDPNAPLADQVRQSIQGSLKRLRVDRIDSLVLHSPARWFDETMDIWKAMENAVREGHVSQLGLSNCHSTDYLDRVYREASVKPAVLQNRFYGETDYDRGLRAYCAREGIIYQSFWTLTANPQLLGSEPVRAMSAAYGRTAAQILYRALIQCGIVPLIGTTSEAHMQQDVDVFTFQLKDDEHDAIRQLFDGP